MRVLLAALGLALAASSAHAAPSDVGGLAGAIDNAAQAASLQSAALPPAQGSYVFTNVATGQTLSYARDGNHIVPSDGPATPVQVLKYGESVPWVRLQIGDKDKCLSAQWGDSFNLAGVMYSCAVDSGGEVTRAGNTLEPTKQWWLMVPVSDYTGDASTSTHVLLVAQAHSVATREKANRSFSRRRSLHSSSSPAFARVKRGDSNVDVTPVAEPRQAWSVRAAEFQAAEAKRIEEEKLALEAEARKAAERATAARKSNGASSTASGAASHTAALASTAPAPSVNEVVPSPSSTVEAAVDPVSLVKVDTAVDDGVEDVTPAEEVYDTDSSVKLNVGKSASSGAYFIIPVDHLIDSHEITSFRAQSTALDLWDPEDEYQHWLVESV
ncbi:hypothetical protein JCM3775_006339 [Rhodotorula graminis]